MPRRGARAAKRRISVAKWLLRGTFRMAADADARRPAAAGSGHGPRHVALIMDGNGRWAARRGLPRASGHEAGLRAVRSVLDGALEEGIAYLSLFVFSTENWNRPSAEVNALMRLAEEASDSFEEYVERGVRLRWLGSKDRLPPTVIGALHEAEERTRAGRAMTVAFCFNHGGRDEIVRTAAVLARRAAAGRLDPEAIDEPLFARHLPLPDLPDIDLLIRTSGEQRLSNFMLWRAAYAEFFFVDTLWPDFTGDQLRAAVAAFAARKRRFGTV
ncbi:polyprenyl diphosphate synthase [Streptomyces sp. NPDC049585]|uniref:polyprenyl diphosphate synthase n=1 Tax=Streptomyces sp. NPDC049585 TaxID=3155154 RepID=UPI0034433096